jgi:hypothetical protein
VIYGYHEHVKGHDIEAELRLILLWRAHHEALGIETRILGEYHASKSKLYPQFVEAIDKLVGGKPGRPTFMRWLAMAHVAGGRGIMMDYDTFLYPVVWDDLNPIFHLSSAECQELRLYQGCRAPLVIGTEASFERQAMRFAGCAISNPPADLTDETILQVQAEKLPDTLQCLPYVKEYGHDGWDTALAVRYSRSSPIQAHGPRHIAIPKLRNRIIPQ